MAGRLSPLPPDDWAANIAPLKDSFAGRLNVYRTMAHHPDLLAAWAPLRAHVVQNNTLGPERLEIVILRIAARLGSGYEWTHHVQRASKLGMAAARIQAMAGPTEAMASDDALLARGVDALIDDTRLPADLLTPLTEALGKTGVLDLMATVGFYKVLGCIAETHGIATDDCD